MSYEDIINAINFWDNWFAISRQPAFTPPFDESFPPQMTQEEEAALLAAEISLMLDTAAQHRAIRRILRDNTMVRQTKWCEKPKVVLREATHGWRVIRVKTPPTSHE